MIYFAKLSPKAVIPSKSFDGDAAFDLFAIEAVNVSPNSFVSVGVGIAMAGPKNICFLIQGRSGFAHKDGVFTIGNVVDSNYRGEIHVCLVNLSRYVFTIVPGMRIAQILPIRLYDRGAQEAAYDALPESSRKTNGLGSTNKGGSPCPSTTSDSTGT
jgi:dUTP pyrophosphatase